ncbi:unnamed protein product [Rotaria socialis]|uniref:Chromatin target of PRMT1 protein C-terminal domain-containing protein n=1 Tax=Rotaria socialis TaxID=392032 RepID=A0A819WFE5_9BILA|nr:unnamed protein product [Rotaria socialis]CAF4122821.1 unnamed protein product [Rotaria socialis]
MIPAKIILKSATKLTLNERFGEIAKQAPLAPRIEQQTSVIIPKSRRDLFGNKQSATQKAANQLKKRSINYRLGLGGNNNNNNNNAPAFNRQYAAPKPSRIFQRLSYGNRRRGGGANSYLFGGQSGMGLRLRGQGRVGTRVFHSRTRGYLNNNTVSRFGGYSRRGSNNNKINNNNNRGRRFGNKQTRGRPGGNKNVTRGRGNGRNQNRKNNNNNTSLTKETLDNDIESYMAKTNIDNSSMDINAV